MQSKSVLPSVFSASPPLSLPPLTLVLGGARSGKSRYAETLVESRKGTCVYLATAEAGDEEMAARIREHRARRGARWRTEEVPLDLVGGLRATTGKDRYVLVDCLTLWLSNLMAAGRDIDAETEALIAALLTLGGPAVLVANEVGLGIVPENALARRFRDGAGRLNQAVAGVAQSVVFVAAALPMHLKSPTAPTSMEFSA